MQTIIIGHKNPDMDSICSALAYARLKQLLGVPNVIAARAGNTNARIDFVLKKFSAEAPVFLSDVAPKVSDVMQRDAVAVRAESSVYDALQLIAEKQLRGLPVTDEKNHCLGLLSAFKLSHLIFPSREESGSTRTIVASLANIVETFGGTVITGKLSTEAIEQVLMVAAMNPDTFSKRLRKQQQARTILFVGDRDDIQMRAIESGVQAIVVTGGLKVLKSIQKAAHQADVAIVSSPHDTATSVLLARGGVARRADDRTVHQLWPRYSAGRGARTGRVVVVLCVSSHQRGRNSHRHHGQERFHQTGSPAPRAGGPQ